MTSPNTKQTITIKLAFTPQQLEKMLANARAGGSVEAKVKLKVDSYDETPEVILG